MRCDRYCINADPEKLVWGVLMDFVRLVGRMPDVKLMKAAFLLAEPEFDPGLPGSIMWILYTYFKLSHIKKHSAGIAQW